MPGGGFDAPSPGKNHLVGFPRHTGVPCTLASIKSALTRISCTAAGAMRPIGRSETPCCWTSRAIITSAAVSPSV